ncbi:MAG: type II secretion system F family protein, partial [Pseudomonadota bacterium]
MNFYRYKVLTPTGEIDSGIIRLHYNDEFSALSYFERDGGTAILVKKLGPFATRLIQVATPLGGKKLSRPIAAEFLGNLSLMLRSGITLVTALREVAKSTDRPDLAANIDDIIIRIEGGASFSETAALHPNIFSKTILYLVKLGEETGKLERMLHDGAEHLRKIDTIVRETKGALMYPAVVLVVMFGAMLFWFYFVVPQIMGLF